MISIQSPKKNVIKHKSTYQKGPQRKFVASKSVYQNRINQKDIIKQKKQKQKPIRRQQLKSLSCHQNPLKKQSSQNQSSQSFSKQNKSSSLQSKSNSSRFKFSFRKLSQNSGSKINSNGFSTCPPPFTQLVPPILFMLMTCQIIILSTDFMKLQTKIIILSVMGLLLFPIAYLWYITTSISPTDEIQLQHLQFIKNPMLNQNFNVKKYKYFCNLCKTCIGQKSFHCNKCNRCVQYFDHHCKWLNNCIGAKNYIEFFQLVLCSQLFMVFFYSVNVITLIDIRNQYQDPLPGIFWFAITIIAISVIPFVAISMLLSLHLYLVIAKRSTIQLILQNRKKNKIHPQSNGQNQQLNTKAGRLSPLPMQSPLVTPFHQNQHMIIKQTNQLNNQSLSKFKLNLSKSLRRSKINLVKNEQKRRASKQSPKDQCQSENKISFKPTILKKSSNFQNDQKKKVTQKQKNNSNQNQTNHKKSKSNPKSIRIKQQDKSLDSSRQQEFEQSGKQLFSRLKYTVKKDLSYDDIDNPYKSQTKQQKKQGENSFRTQKQYETSPKIPKRLQSMAKNTISQRKIKFKTKVQKLYSDRQEILFRQKQKQNRSPSLKQRKNRRIKSQKKQNQIDERQLSLKKKRNLSSQKNKKTDLIKQQESPKPKSSRLFQVMTNMQDE